MGRKPARDRLLLVHMPILSNHWINDQVMGDSAGVSRYDRAQTFVGGSGRRRGRLIAALPLRRHERAIRRDSNRSRIILVVVRVGLEVQRRKQVGFLEVRLDASAFRNRLEVAVRRKRVREF